MVFILLLLLSLLIHSVARPFVSLSVFSIVGCAQWCRPSKEDEFTTGKLTNNSLERHKNHHTTFHSELYMRLCFCVLVLKKKSRHWWSLILCLIICLEMKDRTILQLLNITHLEEEEESILIILCPKGYIYNIASASMAHGTSWKRGQKDCEKLQYQEVCCKTAFPRNGCLNKTRTVKTSIEKFVWSGENFIESCPRRRTWPTNDYWEKDN